MHHKVISTVIIFFVLLCIVPYNVAAQLLTDLQSKDVNITLIYTSDEGESSAQVKKLDLLLNHFTNSVNLVTDNEVTEDDMKFATHIVYYGENKQNIHEDTMTLLERFSASIIWIGENSEQMSAFEQLILDRTVKTTKIKSAYGKKQTTSLDYPIEAKQIKESKDIEVLLYGQNELFEFPLFIQKENHYFLAASQIEGKLKYIFADLLHEIIPNDHTNKHLAYIRLEDIHPMSDPKKLLAVGEYLNERNIPYILVVIPVYITPGTGEREFFEQSSELVKVLQYLQATGGTVISHGYTHQYRDSETGEGFEFWDVENEQFIIEQNPLNNIEIIKTQDQFANQEQYDSYLQSLQAQEEKYIEERLTNSIHELTYYKLYPLAFEAPHYTMSQNGYEITGHYFSTIFGQVQYTDKTWELMGAPPYVTTANFLNGMTLLPETIGYVDPTVQPMLKENEEKLEQTLIVRDSVIGGFYHPYFGVEYLPDFLALYEDIPNIEWLDLKQTEQHVQTSKVHISQNDNGDLKISNRLKWWDHFIRQNQASLLEKVLWGVTALVFVFVLLFMIFSVHLRTQLKKQLFEERKKIG